MADYELGETANCLASFKGGDVSSVMFKLTSPSGVETTYPPGDTHIQQESPVDFLVAVKPEESGDWLFEYSGMVKDKLRQAKGGFSVSAAPSDDLTVEVAAKDNGPEPKAKASHEYKVFGAAQQQVSDRTVTGICAVFGNVDDGGDRLHPGAFTKTIKENKGRVRHLWNHDADQPPTAVIRDLREISKAELPSDLLNKFPDAKGGLQVTREYLNTPRAEEILAGIRAGAINEMSFAFFPVLKDFSQHEGKSVRNLREVRLLDTSDVPWGMNPASRAVKGALAFKANPTAAYDAPWDAAAEMERAAVDDLRLMCTWTANPEAKAGYVLPHHRADDGHSVVWRGVSAAMAALTSGAADVPIEARRDAFDHLVKHYEQFGQEPPDFALVEFGYAVADTRRMWAEAEGKIGRMISAANMGKLKAAIDTLQQILLAAEPPSPEAMMDKALGVREMFVEAEEMAIALERLAHRHA